MGEVCELKKTLYGLKQDPQAWFEKFTTVIASFGFCSSDHDSTMFFRTTYHVIYSHCMLMLQLL